MSEQSSNSKLCPYCGEEIKATAILCRFCNRPLPGHENEVPIKIGSVPESVAGESAHSDDTKPLSNKASNVSNDNKMHYESNYVKLISANCPNCGGALQISANNKIADCPYCGHKIFIQDPTRILVEKNFDSEKYLELARLAEESWNYQGAYNYYSQIIEFDPENIEAWLGKGFTVGMLSSENNIRVKEASTCTHQAFELLNKLGLNVDNNLKDLTIRRLDLIVHHFDSYMPSNLYKEIITRVRPKDLDVRPYQGYVSALILAWEFDRSKEKTYKLAFEVSSLIRCTKFHDNLCNKFVAKNSPKSDMAIHLTAIYKDALLKVDFSEVASQWDKNFDLNKIFE